MTTIHGAPSFQLSSDWVDLSVTQTAGMLAPVTFHLDGTECSPYALAPWEPDQIDTSLPPLLKYLRGDFFCLPFGPQDDGEPHGDTANGDWSLVEKTDKSLHLAIEPGDTGGRIEKLFSLRDGEAAIYCEHRISGVEGRFSYGTHPVLDLSNLAEGQGRVTTSPFRWGSVNPGLFSDPANHEFQILVPGATFTELSSVPMASRAPTSAENVETAGSADLTRYPSRQGFEDLIMLVNEAASESQPFAWTACVFDRYLWFSLKNPADFPSTLFWMSNGGRKSAPWNGTHLARLGMEEVCSHFADNVTSSRQDKLSSQNVPTTRAFSVDETVSLRIVQAAAAVPDDFGAVASIAPRGEGGVTITGENGTTVEVFIDWGFVS